MELTAERIRDAIIHGELPLGSKVSEQKLADKLQISRSPVRESLALLQIEGLVRVLPKRGSFVFTPDMKNVDDLCEHRVVLESACLEFAMTRNPGELIGGLRQGIDKMKNALSRQDTAGYSRADLGFHRAIVQSGGNDSIARVYETTIGPLMALRTHLFTIMNIHLDRSMAEHRALLTACENGELERAQSVITVHIQHLAEHFRTSQSEPTELKPAR